MKNTVPLISAKLKSKAHLQKFFELFFGQLASKFEKVLIWPKNIFLWKNNKKVSENAEFHADFESVEKGSKKCTKKKLKAKQVWRTWVKVKKVHISVTFLQIIFFCAFFQTFFNGFKISVKFCVLWYPYWIFALIRKCAGNGSKKRKIVLYVCVLEFNYASIKGFA